MILVDTSAWFALLAPGDVRHAGAHAWLAGNSDSLLTTDYIIDETLTLLRARGQSNAAVDWGEKVFDGVLARVHYLTPADIRDAWDVFRRFADKDWSFTDCTSYAVIASLGLTHAFAFDQHFRQFGTIAIVP